MASRAGPAHDRCSVFALPGHLYLQMKKLRYFSGEGCDGDKRALSLGDFLSGNTAAPVPARGLFWLTGQLTSPGLSFPYTLRRFQFQTPRISCLLRQVQRPGLSSQEKGLM